MKKQSEKREGVRFRVPTLLKYSGDPHSAGEQVANIRDISQGRFSQKRTIPENLITG